MTTDNAINMTCETQTFLIEDGVERQPAKPKGKLSRYLILSVIIICASAVLLTLAIAKNLRPNIPGKNIDGEIPVERVSKINKIDLGASISPSTENTSIDTEIDSHREYFPVVTPSIIESTSLESTTPADEVYPEEYDEPPSTTTLRAPSKLMKHPNRSKFNIKCGIVQSTDRIQRGKNAALFEHPWMVVLMLYNKTSMKEWVACGGSLLNEQIVLTAAHCIKNEEDPEMRIRIGEYDTEAERDCDKSNQCAEPVQTFYPSDFTTIVHPQYSSNDGSNDLALIKLKTPVTFSKSVHPICLPFDDDEIPNKVQIIGYGKTLQMKKQPTKLQRGFVHTLDVNHPNCKKEYENLKNPRILSENQFCANQEFTTTTSNGTLKQASVDTCIGDSGSPALWPSPSVRQTIYGVVSSGENAKCGKVKAPGIYMKVYPFLEWILDNA